MDADAFADEFFKLDPTVRYVAVVDQEYHVLVSKQREGVVSYTSDSVARNFVSIVPQIIVEAVEKLSPFLGEVGGVTAHYQKALMVFYRFEDLIVVVSFEPEQATPFYGRVTEAFKRLSARHLGKR